MSSNPTPRELSLARLLISALALVALFGAAARIPGLAEVGPIPVGEEPNVGSHPTLRPFAAGSAEGRDRAAKNELALFDRQSAMAADGPGPIGASSRPAVVVELFTSQGCSSCPAADRLLSRLGRELRPDGLLLVPLAFHVDYWNRIGWVDPFSAPAWSARQRRYAERFGLRSIYTPQAVLNGRLELVGSREAELRRRIRAAVESRGGGGVEILNADLAGAGAELVVELAAWRSGELGEAPLVAHLAVFESGLVTRVESGENARRTLANDYVVRLLRPAILFRPGEASRRERLRIGLDSSWAAERLGLAAFLQDRETLEIAAAAVLDPLVLLPHEAAGPDAGLDAHSVAP